MKRLVAMMTAMVLCIGAWAAQTELVHVGTYKNAHDGKEYSVILEYKGDKFVALEITSRPSKNAKGTSIVVKGNKKIYMFNKSLKAVEKCYKKVDEDFANYSDKMRLLLDPNSKSYKNKYYTNVHWPKTNIAGVVNNDMTQYEFYDIFDEANIGYNFVVNKGMREMGLIAVSEGAIEYVKNYRTKYESLKSTIHFDSVESFSEFIKLTDVETLKGRIEAKRKAESK